MAAMKILLRIFAVSTLLVPSVSQARATGDVSQFVVDVDGAYAGANSHEFSGPWRGNLQAGPGTLDVSGVVQSNLLLDAEPLHVWNHLIGAGRTTDHECAVRNESLLRLGLLSDYFLSADVRHMFIRHRNGGTQNGGAAYPDTGGVAFRGTFSHEQEGDTGAVLLGGGIEF